MSSPATPLRDVVGPVRQVGGDPQRVGPLALRRYVKHDGRALLMFARVEPAAGDAEPAAAERP